jgi:hypothetical protein
MSLWKILLGLGLIGGAALALSGAKGGHSEEEADLVAEFRALVMAEKNGTIPQDEINARAAEIGARLSELGWSFEKKLKMVREAYEAAGMAPPLSSPALGGVG